MDDMTDDLPPTPPTLQVSAADRLRVFREDDAALAELAEKTHERAMGDGEDANPAGHLDLKIRERRAAMWGYDSPVRFDMVMMERNQHPSRHDQMMATIKRFIAQGTPAQKAMRQRLMELPAGQALELLGPPQSDGNGAALLALDDDKLASD